MRGRCHEVQAVPPPACPSLSRGGRRAEGHASRPCLGAGGADGGAAVSLVRRGDDGSGRHHGGSVGSHRGSGRCHCGCHGNCGRRTCGDRRQNGRKIDRKCPCPSCHPQRLAAGRGVPAAADGGEVRRAGRPIRRCRGREPRAAQLFGAAGRRAGRIVIAAGFTAGQWSLDRTSGMGAGLSGALACRRPLPGLHSAGLPDAIRCPAEALSSCVRHGRAAH